MIDSIFDIKKHRETRRRVLEEEIESLSSLQRKGSHVVPERIRYLRERLERVVALEKNSEEEN